MAKRRRVSKAGSKPAGSDGVYLPGGFSYINERNPKLIGTEKWVTYDNVVLNTAIIAAAIRTWVGLGASAKWTAKPNPRGGKDAERAAEIVTEGLLENSMMSVSWRDIVRLQLMKSFRGFAAHSFAFRRRGDGMVVFSDFLHLPQWTVYRWIKPDEDGPWTGIEQRTRTGRSYLVDRSEMFYSVEGLFSADPAGVGLLRHIAEIARVRDVYTRLEGIGAQTDLNGMPIVRAPLAELKDAAKGSDEEKLAAVQAQTQFLEKFLNGHNKTADQGIMLPSSVYTTKDAAQTPSAIYKWAVDVVRAAINIAPIGDAIMRLDREMARVMCAEWLLMGEGGGSRAMHQDKTDMFGMSINGATSDIGSDGTRQVAAPIVARNGLDPETCTPTLVPEPIATQDVETACRSLLALSQAGLADDDDAPDVLRDRMDLPSRPKRDPGQLMAPRGKPGLTPNITTTKPPPGPDKTEPTATSEGDPGNVSAAPAKRRGRRAA